MTTYLKEGVHGNLNPPMRRAKGRLVILYKSKGLDFLITSKGEGNHHPGSCHYEESAIDFKRQGVPKIDVVEAIADDDFDVVEYDDDRDIFHVEWDPKNWR